MTEQAVKFKDFTRKRTPVFFTIEGERYDCVPAVPVDDLQELVNGFGEVTAHNVGDALRKFFGMVMSAQEAERFYALMSSKTNPLDSEQATEIMNWLLEVYGMRPLAQSSDSSAGSPTDGVGTLSTAGVSVVE